MHSLIQTTASDALGWALLHSLWQATIAAALLLPIRSTRSRYIAGCVALSVVFTAFLFTFSLYLPFKQAGTTHSDAVRFPILFAADTDALRAAASPYADPAAYLTPLWFVGAVAFQARTIAGWIKAERLRRRGVCLVSEEWEFRLRRLAERMCVPRPIKMLESALAPVPMVIGYLRPAILVPAGLLSGMPPEHMEAILLHELAHVRRHDYLINLLQTVVEGLLFFNPAVWWISSVIRQEREHCCDDLAAAALSAGGAYEYAVALTELQTRRSETGLERAAFVAANGGNLVKRIQRLLYPEQQHRAATATWALAPLLATIALMMMGMASQVPAAPQQDSNSPYQRWVNEDVAYIIEPGEREAYLRLQTNDERNQFIEQFWLRRDPTPGSAENEFKEEHYRRIAYVNERYSSAAKVGWRSDRGRVYIVYGPPDEIESHPSGRNGEPPFEQWLYNYINAIGNRVVVDFVDVDRNGDYRQTSDPNARK